MFPPPPPPRRSSSAHHHHHRHHHRHRSPSPRSKMSPSENGSTTSNNGSKPTSPKSSVGGDRTVKRLRLSRALTIPEDTAVSEACRRMAARRINAVLLTDSNALLSGIVTDKDVATRVIAEELKPDQISISKIMTRNPTFVNADALAIEALQKMVHGKFRHLPVVDNGEVIAMLDITKCLYDAITKMERAAEQGNAIAATVEGVERQWGSSYSAPHAFLETLKERMFKPTLSTLIDDTSKLSIVFPTDSIQDASKMMRDLHTNYVLVMSANYKIQGILTSKDILMRVVAANIPPHSTPVEKLMTTNPDCAKLETTILEALHMMHDAKFLHIPVLDKDGSVAACVDVLQITHAAISLAESSSGALSNVTNLVMQKFWDSALASEAGDDFDSQSEMSMMMPSEAAELVKPETPGLGSSFSFKFVDRKGRFHRFDFGFESLEDLVSTMMQRMGITDDKQRLLLLYDDDEGDRVLLTSDSDLIGAVTHTRSMGQKILRLHVELHEAQQQAKPEPEPKLEAEPKLEPEPEPEPMPEPPAKATATVEGSRWASFPLGFLAGVAAATSCIGVAVYLRRPRVFSTD